MYNIKKPNWLKVSALDEGVYLNIKEVLDKYNLKTVCQSALCPNINKCWQEKSATFLLMGDTCTRNCRFCAVKKGKPNKLNNDEPFNIALAAKELGLEYVVLTCVDRDDLSDFGARHFYRAVKEIKNINNNIIVEILVPDFSLNEEYINILLNAKPDVVAHNLETVRKLSPYIRDKRANYDKSQEFLKLIKKLDSKIKTKTSLLVGLGESENEMLKTLEDIKKSNVDIVVIGQYLQPSSKQIKVKEFIDIQKFEQYKGLAKELGIKHIASSPLARSSYNAKALYANQSLNLNH